MCRNGKEHPIDPRQHDRREPPPPQVHLLLRISTGTTWNRNTSILASARRTVVWLPTAVCAPKCARSGHRQCIVQLLTQLPLPRKPWSHASACPSSSRGSTNPWPSRRTARAQVSLRGASKPSSFNACSHGEGAHDSCRGMRSHTCSNNGIAIHQSA